MSTRTGPDQAPAGKNRENGAIGGRSATALEAVAKFVFGFDLFISYARQDASGYGQALRDELSRLDYSCYLDRQDLPAGERLHTSLTRALLRSKTLVLVGTETALTSPYINLEVTTFQQRARPTILAIDFEGSLREAPWEALRDVVWIDESRSALQAQRPSPGVVAEIDRRFRFTRRKNLMRGLFGVVTLGLLVMAALSWRQRNEALAQRRIALAGQLATQSQVLLAQPGEALHLSALLAGQSLLSYPTLEAHNALRDALALLSRRISSVTYDAQPPLSITFPVVVFSPGADRLAILDGEDACIHDVARQHVRVCYPALGAGALSFSSDGKLFALANADSIRVWTSWDSENPVRFAAIAAPRESVRAVVFDAAARHLAAARGDTVEVWDVETRQSIARLGHAGPPGLVDAHVRAVAFSRDGVQLATGVASDFSPLAEADVKLWVRWREGEAREVATLPHGSSVTALAFTPDGVHLLARAGNVHVWDAARAVSLGTLPGGRATLSADGKLVATAQGREVYVWENWHTDARRLVGRLVHDIEDEDVFLGFGFTPRGDTVATVSVAWAQEAAPYRVQQWESRGFRYIAQIEDRAVRFVSVAFDRDAEHLVTGSSPDDALRLWNIGTREQLGAAFPLLSDFAFSPPGNLLATAGADGFEVWSSWREARPVPHAVCGALPARGSPVSVRFNETGTRLAALSREDGNDLIQIWDLDRCQAVDSLRDATLAGDMHEAGYLAILSPSGSLTLRTLDAARPVASLPSNGTFAAIDRRARYIATINGSVVRVHERASGEEVARFAHDPAASVRAVAFTPDAQYVATAAGALDESVPRSAHVWELSSAREIARFTHDGDVNDVAFSADGSRLATASSDHTARVWLWRAADLVAEVCGRLPRDLTPEEWQHYLGQLPRRGTCETASRQSR